MRSSQKVSGRNPRAIRACARCRRRKIKCDFVYPQCGACIAVGVECLGYDTTTGGEQPRSLVKFLENRIAYLEIELSLLQANVAGEQDLDQKTIPHAFPGIRSHLLRSLILRNDLDPTRGVASWLSAPYLSSSLLPTLASDGGATNVVDSSQMKDNDLAQKRDIASIPRNVVDIMLRHYSEVYLAQYPIVDEAELMEQCNRVYDRKATPFDLFVVCMALSISAHTLIRHDLARAIKAADEFWETAILNLDSVLQQNLLTRLQAIMLLCHYSFVNPSIVDSGMCSRAAITLCVQLGLHQEPTPENIRSHIDLESQRRIFWTCYVLDAQNNMMSGKPSSLVHVHISVRFPTVEKEDSKCGEKTAIANCWYAFRQIETEITLGLLHHDNCRDSKITAPEWLDDARTRIDYWRDNLDSHKWAPRIEFRYIAYHFQKMRLNRMSPRIPHPTNFMRRECIAAGAFIAFEIHRYSNHGNFFYWHHCCCHFFEIGIVLVESTHTGLDLILQQDESFLDLTNMDTIMRVMQSIPLVLKKMTHRWPQVKLMAFELEALFKPALQRLKDSVRGRVISQSSEDGLVAYQLSLIKRYLFCGRGTNLGYQREESLVPYPQFGQQIIAAQNLLSLNNSITGDHIDVEKVHDMLQPINTGFENLWSPATNVEHTSIIQPVDEADNAPILHDATSPSIVSTVNENNPFSILDLDPNWLTHTENPLSWHGNGLELDDIFTAFNEGNIY